MRVLDDAFTSVMFDLSRLQRTDVDLPGLHRQVRDVDFALGRLCDALEAQRSDDDPPEALARRAFHDVLALGQTLDGADSEDCRTAQILDLTRAAVGELLDTLAPFVSRPDRALRRVVLDGESLEDAIAWMRGQPEMVRF